MDKLQILFEQLNEKPIIYHRIYAKITESVTAGLLLSQLVYWNKVMKNKEFYKTDEEFCQELCMGLYELRNAKNALTKLNLVSIKRRGIPRKTHYKVNILAIITLITSVGENPTQVLGKTQHKREGKPNTLYTESTTESTTENTPLSPYNPPASGGIDEFKNSLKESPLKNNSFDGEPSHSASTTEHSTIEQPKEEHNVFESNESKQIAEIINCFKQLNPMINFGHRGYRKSALQLIKQFGFEEAKKIADIAVSIQGKDFVPVITNPTQLVSKFGQLKSCVGRKINEDQDSSVKAYSKWLIQKEEEDRQAIKRFKNSLK